MSEITITRAHSLTPRKARLAAESVATRLKADFHLDYAWDDDHTLSFSRPGLRGRLTLERRQVTVQVQLGLLLSPLKPMLEREIHDYFDQRFTPRAA